MTESRRNSVHSLQGGREAAERALEVMRSLTYKPRSAQGQQSLESIGRAIDSSKIAGLGPSEGISLAGVAAGPARVTKNVTRAEAAAVPGQMASVGASGVAPLEQARAMVAPYPVLKAAVEKAGQKIDLSVLQRHVEAESLPIPVKLTTGQATQDVSALSNEMNMRGKHPAIAARLTEQNKALSENVTAIREAAAPDVYVTSKPDIGEMIIDAYKAKDAAKNAEISGLYGKLREANGGAFPLDAKAFVTSADQALHKELLFDHVPPELRRTMDRVSKDGMTFENFESLRTNLARIQRSQSADGNVKAAAGTIRQALEDLPMPAGAEHLKPLADAARSAAKDRFAAIEADPAYKAVVRGTVSADKFIDKFVTSADVKNVQTMKQNLAHDPSAQQAMAAGTMNRLRESALGAGENFSQAGYNKALEALRPKLGILFEPQQSQQIETLGKVARYTQAQPRGSFVNTSNTATALMAEHAKGAAEGAVNVAAHGVPVGTWARKIGGKYIEGRAINEALQTGGGIKLKDVK